MTRRRGLGALVLVALGALVGIPVLLFSAGEPAQAPAAGSTRVSTLADPDRDGFLEPADGEPLVDRTELSPGEPTGRELGSLAQLSDPHVRDEESPARAVQLDRLGSPVTEAFRPQEALSAQTLAASLDSLDELDPDVVLLSGDLIDSAQSNELELALDVLEGGPVDPDSGARGYDGPQAASSADPFIYRPDVDAPLHPGLLDAAQRRFRSPGVGAPWLPVLGNHDLLVQGEAAPTPALERIAVGGERLVELDPSLRAPRGELDRAALARSLAGGLPGRTRRTPADPGRRHLEPGELIDRLAEASGAGIEAGKRLDYSYDVGSGLRLIVLDVVSRSGGAGGRVGPSQLDWLRRQLGRAAADQRWAIVASHQPLGESAGGERALRLIGREPRVVAALSGHLHDTRIEPRRSPSGGFWLIETPSLADYPQQARALRLVETADGVALETWMVDHSSAGLAAVSRELAFLDAQGGRPRGFAGEPEDRNARLFLAR